MSWINYSDNPDEEKKIFNFWETSDDSPTRFMPQAKMANFSLIGSFIDLKHGDC